MGLCALNEYSVAMAAAFVAFHVIELHNDSYSIEIPISRLAAHFEPAD